VRETERRWLGMLTAAGRALRVRVESGVADVLGLSRAATIQIIDVLIDNAIRHGAGAVTIEFTAAGATTAVDVRDEGEPLQTEAHELFRKRDADAERGIGLPFARRLAEAEGARLVLAASSPPTFRLLFPSGSA
jgi:signal transduction histidine kinase